MRRRQTRWLPALLALTLTACLFDNGRPAPEPDPITLAREYSGLWVPDDARILKYEDSFYNNGRLRMQGILDLTVQLEPAVFDSLARQAVDRGYADLASRRTMPADSVTYGDAYALPMGTPGFYLLTRGKGPNKILVVLREDTNTLSLLIEQLSMAFFDAADSNRVLTRYGCEAGSCSIEPIGWTDRR